MGYFKEGCAFPLVIWYNNIRMEQYRDDHHRENASHFITYNRQRQWIPFSDKYDTKATMVFGNICIAISYALLGPADCFKMGNATLTTIIISMVILGVGLAAAIVPSMADMVVEAK